MSLSLLARMEDEMESDWDAVYSQLKLLLQAPKKHLSTTIKKEIWTHLRNFNYGVTWIEDGDYLIKRAHAEKAARQHEENNDDVLWWDMADDDTNFEAINRFEEVLELWESRLNRQKAKNDGYDDESHPNGHRAGIKRDKTEFWSRPGPTRWHKHHQTLRKHRQEKKTAKRQQDRC